MNRLYTRSDECMLILNEILQVFEVSVFISDFGPSIGNFVHAVRYHGVKWFLNLKTLLHPKM